MRDRIWTNDERTVLVSLWADGTLELATRDHPSHTWGPPVRLLEDEVVRRALSEEPGTIGGDARAKWIATMDHEDLLRLRNAVGAEIHRRSVQ